MVGHTAAPLLRRAARPHARTCATAARRVGLSSQGAVDADGVKRRRVALSAQGDGVGGKARKVKVRFQLAPAR